MDKPAKATPLVGLNPVQSIVITSTEEFENFEADLIAGEYDE